MSEEISAQEINDLLGAIDDAGSEKEKEEASTTVMESIGESGKDREDQYQKEEDSGQSKGQTDEIATLKAQIELLTKLISEKAELPKKEEDPLVIMPSLEEFDYFSGKDPRDVLEDPEEFANTFTRNIDTRLKMFQDAILEAVYSSMPKILNKHVVEQIESKKAADSFYTAHADLISHKGLVAKTANFVAENFPDLKNDKDKFFEKVADQTRLLLGITAKEKEVKKPGTSTKPALVNKVVSGGNRFMKQVEPTETEKQINDLLKVIGG